MSDGRKHASWVARNREPILEVLLRVMPSRGRVLELASGTGEHAAYFTPRLPGLTWQPSDNDPESLASIHAWRAHASCEGFLEPIELDVLGDEWPPGPFDAVVAMNLVHIAPWGVCEALMRGAGRVLARGGVVFLYGPFFREDVPTAESNIAFDADLRRRNPAWGIRSLEEIRWAAGRHGLVPTDVIEMPANNLCVAFMKQPGQDTR